MYQILEQIQTEVYTTGDTYTKVRVRLVCDALSDLPGIHDISGLELQMGSTAHIVQTAQNMMMQSNGTWSEQTTNSIASLVTSISNLESEMTGVHSDIDILVNQTGELRAAAALLIDSGAKNKIPIPSNSQTLANIIYTPDGKGRIATTGIASGGSFYIASNLDLTEGEELSLTGCPSGGSYASGFALYIAKNAAGAVTLAYDEGDGVTFTVPETANYNIRIIVRSGVNMDGKTFEPMLTYPEYLKYTTRFVPYSPSNAELYALIHSYHP